MTDKAIITLGDTKLEAPVIIGTEDEHAIDIGALRAKTGFVTLDPAFMNTASTKSAITFIDGDKGILRYRGIPIEQLAEKSSFVETAYLLIYGHLPNETQLTEWSEKLTRHSLLHEDMKHFFEGFSATAHPMAILSAMVAALSSYYPDSLDPDNVDQRDITIARLVSKVRTIAAFAYKKSIGQPFVYPKNSLSYCENFLNMMFSVPAEEYEVDPEFVKVMNLLLILHADHEQNCSTSTVRMVGSSKANLFASISAGICALWGPLHGGANQEVLEMLDGHPRERRRREEVRRDGEGQEQRLQADGLRPPRVQELRPAGEDHQGGGRQGARASSAKNDPLLDIAKALEEAALKDSYFVERKLYPNVDFYSGIIYRAMGFPTNTFTVLFALGRLPGWIAHWKEMIEDNTTKIARPRQIYTGPTMLDYVPIEKR